LRLFEARQIAQIFAEILYTVNSSSNSNRGNSHIASRYTTHIAYNTESYKPIDMNTNPSINAYKHRIAYNARIDRTVCLYQLHPTPQLMIVDDIDIT